MNIIRLPMRLSVFIFILLFFVQDIFAQQPYTSKSDRAIKFYEEGRKNYQLYYFNEAEKDLRKAIDVDKKFIEAYIILAKLYWDQNRLEEAVKTFDEGLKIDPSFYPGGYFYKGVIEIKLSRYSDALTSFNTVLNLEKNDKRLMAMAKKGANQAAFAVEAVKHPVEFHPVRLPPAINTNDDEYWPSLSADESELVFTRLVGSANKSSNMQEDLYESLWKNNAWTKAKNVGPPLNTSDNEGAQSLSANGKVMVYTVCNRRGVLGRCDLYYSQKEGDKWSDPVNMGAPVNSAAKETQPGLTADGHTVYFSSDRPGGKGGLDIWMSSQNQDGTWGTPVNLGDSVNTPGDELSPFIHPDNNTLYFSSDYRLGMGGFDIFYSRRNSEGKWKKAVNLGYPINTCHDEIGLIINARGNEAYYSTDVDSGTGKDIYRFDLYAQARPQEVSYLKGKVFDATTKKPLMAGFELYNLSNDSLVFKSYSDGYSGEFLVSIPTNCDYMLNVSKEGYLFYSENFSLDGIYHIEKPFYKDIPLQPIVVGKSIVLKNIFFDTDSFRLKPASKAELNKLVQFLNTNKNVNIEISGHTDNSGTEQYNQILSERRAKSVVDYLVQSGIDTDRLAAKGYGLSKPVDTNETEKGRANNRRTEMTIVK